MLCLHSAAAGTKSLKNIKSQVALADRNSNTAKDNEEKLEKFVMSIK